MIRATRSFSVDDQRWFGRVSGDVNPLHMDPLWAEATFPGAPVVHGVHALLWGLDAHLAHAGGAPVHGIRATFLKPILVGDEVHVASASDSSSFRLLVRGVPMLAAKLAAQDTERGEGGAVEAAMPVGPTATPRARSLSSLSNQSGRVALPVASCELIRAFPNVCSAAGPRAASGLAAVSALVGMECPGLHSLLAELSVAFTASPTDSLAFRVTKVEPAFSRVQMDVNGLGVAGSVGAFAGRDEPEAPSDDAIRAMVSKHEFAGQQPLVVGASGGLGAVTARLLHAGGAQPILTWHRSRPAADPLGPAGSMTRTVQLDAAEPAAGLAALAESGWQGAHVYYFASPRIFRRRLEAFQGGDLRDFLRVYVEGFYELVRGLLQLRGGAPLVVFYPSTVALDESRAEMFEYALAKRAGESLCEHLQQSHKELTVVVRRLPRVLTRQTMTFLNVKAEAPEQVMAPIVRLMQGRS